MHSKARQRRLELTDYGEAARWAPAGGALMGFAAAVGAASPVLLAATRGHCGAGTEKMALDVSGLAGVPAEGFVSLVSLRCRSAGCESRAGGTAARTARVEANMQRSGGGRIGGGIGGGVGSSAANRGLNRSLFAESSVAAELRLDARSKVNGLADLDPRTSAAASELHQHFWDIRSACKGLRDARLLTAADEKSLKRTCKHIAAVLEFSKKHALVGRISASRTLLPPAARCRAVDRRRHPLVRRLVRDLLNLPAPAIGEFVAWTFAVGPGLTFDDVKIDHRFVHDDDRDENELAADAADVIDPAAHARAAIRRAAHESAVRSAERLLGGPAGVSGAPKRGGNLSGFSSLDRALTDFDEMVLHAAVNEATSGKYRAARQTVRCSLLLLLLAWEDDPARREALLAWADARWGGAAALPYPTGIAERFGELTGDTLDGRVVFWRLANFLEDAGGGAAGGGRGGNNLGGSGPCVGGRGSPTALALSDSLSPLRASLADWPAAARLAAASRAAQTAVAEALAARARRVWAGPGPPLLGAVAALSREAERSAVAQLHEAFAAFAAAALPADVDLAAALAVSPEALDGLLAPLSRWPPAELSRLAELSRAAWPGTAGAQEVFLYALHVCDRAATPPPPSAGPPAPRPLAAVAAAAVSVPFGGRVRPRRPSPVGKYDDHILVNIDWNRDSREMRSRRRLAEAEDEASRSPGSRPPEARADASASDAVGRTDGSDPVSLD